MGQPMVFNGFVGGKPMKNRSLSNNHLFIGLVFLGKSEIRKTRFFFPMKYGVRFQLSQENQSNGGMFHFDVNHLKHLV